MATRVLIQKCVLWLHETYPGLYVSLPQHEFNEQQCHELSDDFEDYADRVFPSLVDYACCKHRDQTDVCYMAMYSVLQAACKKE